MDFNNPIGSEVDPNGPTTFANTVNDVRCERSISSTNGYRATIFVAALRRDAAANE